MSTERTLRTRAALHRILGRQNLADNSFVEVECAVMEVAALCDEGKAKTVELARLSQPHLNAKQIVDLAQESAFRRSTARRSGNPSFSIENVPFVLRRVLRIVLKFNHTKIAIGAGRS
jgi:hypothetical protein